MRALFVAVACALASGVRAQAPNQPIPGSPERVYSLDDALRLIRNDPRLQAADQDIEIATSRVVESRLRFLPELGVQASATKYRSIYPFSLSEDFRNILLFPNPEQNIYSSRAYFNLPIYEGRRTINTLRLAEAAEKQAHASRDAVQLDLILQAKEAFYHLLLAQEKATASAEELKSVQHLLTGQKFAAWDAIEAESSVDATAARAGDASHELDIARLGFLKAMNLELDTPFRLSGTLESQPTPIDVDRVVFRAMEVRPELQSQTFKAQMDAIGVNLALGRRYPTVFLAGDYELTSQDFPLNKNNWDVTIGVKVPFTYDLWSQLRQKKAEQRQGQLTRAELQDRVRLEVRRATSDLQYWQQEWPRRDRAWRKAQTMIGEAAGHPASPLARARAQNVLLELRLSRMTAVAEQLLARARLERAVGQELSP